MRYVKAIWTVVLFSFGFNAAAQSVCDNISVQHEVAVRWKLMIALQERGINLDKVNLEELLKIDSRRLEDIMQQHNLDDDIDTGGNGGRW